MGNISPQEFVTLISKYLDTEKLIRENPSVTKEMIDALLQDIILAKQGKEPTDIHKSHHETTKHKQKDATDLIIHTDGASRGNPGKAGIGVAIFDKNYHLLEEICKFIGESTNNVAEYSAVLRALQWVQDHRDELSILSTINFFLDSQLVVFQLGGQYKIKNEGLRRLYDKIRELETKLNL